MQEIIKELHNGGRLWVLYSEGEFGFADEKNGMAGLFDRWGKALHEVRTSTVTKLIEQGYIERPSYQCQRDYEAKNLLK